MTLESANTRRPLAVYGAGGFVLQMLPILDRARRNGRLVEIVDDARVEPLFDYPVRPRVQIAADANFVIAIADPSLRKKIADQLAGESFETLKSDDARLSPRAEIGAGSILCDFAAVEAGVRIGRHFHGNLYSFVAHDCVIGDHVTFAPRVTCNGNVHIGDRVMVGTGAMIRQGSKARPLRIGAEAVLQMGCVVTRDVEPGTVVKANMVH